LRGITIDVANGVQRNLGFVRWLQKSNDARESCPWVRRYTNALHAHLVMVVAPTLDAHLRVSDSSAVAKQRLDREAHSAANPRTPAMGELEVIDTKSRIDPVCVDTRCRKERDGSVRKPYQPT